MALLLWAYPLLFLMQNVFGSNKGSIDNEYEMHLFIFTLEDFISDSHYSKAGQQQKGFWHERRMGKFIYKKPFKRQVSSQVLYTVKQ